MTGKCKLVMRWSIGVAMAATLLIAGLIGFAPATAPVAPAEPSAPSHAPRTEAQVTVLQRATVEAEAPVPEEDSAKLLPWSGPALAVKAVFRVRPSGADEEGEFTRGCLILLSADGTLVATSKEPGLRLPPGARRVEFKAVGYQPVLRDVPPPEAGAVDFGTVVFEPDAAVRVRISGAPADRGTIRFALGRFPNVPYAQADCTLVHGAAEALLPAPSSEDLRLSAFAQPSSAAPEWFGIEPRVVRLHRGETITVDLQPCPGARITVQVHGPSPALLPHLTVELFREKAREAFPGDSDSPRARLDPEGRAVFHAVSGRCQVRVGGVTCSDAHGFVFTIAEGVLFDVTPEESLVGVVARSHDQPVNSCLSLHGPVVPSRACEPCEYHVLRKSDLMAASQVWLWTEDGGARACPVADLRFDDDIASVDVARTVAEARLTVRADVPSEYSYALGVGAEPLDGGTVVRIGHSTSPFDAVLPAGSWRLRWLCGAAPGPVIEEHIELTPGEHRTVDAAVPVLQRWECRIVDLDQLPPLARFAQPRIDGIYPLGAGGTVTIFLPDAPSPDTRAVIYMHMLKLTVPARVTAVDASNHTFALQHGLGADDRVQLHSRGLGAQNRQIWLASVTEESRIPAWLGADADVLLVPGSERNGCVVERMDQFNQVTCWFSVRHGTREMRLEPQGHQATVRLERPCTRATIRVEGWPGMDPIAVGELLEPGERRIFVADGTRAVLLDLVPKDRLRFPPEQTEMVVR